MPQLDPSTFPSQIFWLTVTFFLLYVIVGRHVVPTISNVILSRKQKIANDLDAADRFQKEAEELEEAYEASLRDTKGKANAIIAKAQEEAQKKEDKALKSLEAKTAKKLDKASSDIAAARGEAYDKLESISADLSAAIANKIASLGVDASAAKKHVKTGVK